jgi:hypothetical protein
VLSVALLANENAREFPVKSPAVHVRVSNTVTWDYPAEWGVQRIGEDLEKRLGAEDEKDREWAAEVPASRKAECLAIPPTTPFSDQPADCVRLFFARDKRAVPSGWESQIAAAPVCKNGASSCEPWERDWSNGELKPGSVVSEKGVVIRPNGRVATWEKTPQPHRGQLPRRWGCLLWAHHSFGRLRDFDVAPRS